jgi:Raf kinase inhibitor-like YbhB/YbcL family protein
MPIARRPVLAPLVGALALLAACSSSGGSGGGAAATTATSAGQAPKASMTITSSAFAAGAAIPVRYTCKGDNVSPPLKWSAPPAGTAQLALVVFDPDAGGGGFVHWVVSGIPASQTELGENAVPQGAVEGRNGAGSGWTGPCPPSGAPHHYHFTIYALSRAPGVQPDSDPRQAIAAIQSAATAQGELIGTFQT